MIFTLMSSILLLYVIRLLNRITLPQAATKVQAGLRGSHTRQELHLESLQPFRRLSERDD